MKEVPQNVSESVRKLNPHLYDIEFYARERLLEPDRLTTKGSKRVRQSSKQPNKLEAEFASLLQREHPQDVLVEQALVFKLANGVNFTVDVVRFMEGGRMVCYEVKGPHAWDDAIVKIKVAAHEWPWIVWWLVWKEDGKWQRQQIIA